jgi:hypothetical protein
MPVSSKPRKPVLPACDTPGPSARRWRYSGQVGPDTRIPDGVKVINIVAH